MRKTIGRNISVARKKCALTQKALAKKAGVSREVIAHYELGHTDISLGKLVLLSKAMKLPILELLK